MHAAAIRVEQNRDRAGIEIAGDDIDRSVSVGIRQGEAESIFTGCIFIRSSEGAIPVSEQDTHGGEVFIGVYQVGFAVAVDVRRLHMRGIGPFEEGEILGGGVQRRRVEGAIPISQGNRESLISVAVVSDGDCKIHLTVAVQIGNRNACRVEVSCGTIGQGDIGFGLKGSAIVGIAQQYSDATGAILSGTSRFSPSPLMSPAAISNALLERA